MRSNFENPLRLEMGNQVIQRASIARIDTAKDFTLSVGSGDSRIILRKDCADRGITHNSSKIDAGNGLQVSSVKRQRCLLTQCAGIDIITHWLLKRSRDQHLESRNYSHCRDLSEGSDMATILAYHRKRQPARQSVPLTWKGFVVLPCGYLPGNLLASNRLHDISILAAFERRTLYKYRRQAHRQHDVLHLATSKIPCTTGHS